jgi:hypothetical protein
LTKSTLEVNRRDIAHLRYSLCEIFLSFQPVGELEREFPDHHREALATALTRSEGIPAESEEAELVISYIANRERVLQQARIYSDLGKQLQKERHDLGIHNQSFSPGQLVMLHDAKTASQKLRPRWRGPFVVTGFGGDKGKSYTLRQINGTLIPRTFYGDHLKIFRLREGCLITGEERSLLTFQNIRADHALRKLPTYVREIPGVAGKPFRGLE